jgi:3-carboxy-cis,cis-muconate cycloisomerase
MPRPPAARTAGGDVNWLPTFDPGFSTASLSRLFAAEGRVAAMCRVEAALAASSGEAGVISAAQAREIESVCANPFGIAGAVGDASSLLAEGWEAGSPVIVLLGRLRQRLSPSAAAALHRGATTQDIVDTAQMLMLGEALADLRRGLVQIGERLRRLAGEHQETPMVGRTFLQHARETSFGLRAAQWLEPLVRHLGGIASLRTQLPVQLGGANGNAAELGEQAVVVTGGLARRLGLVVPTLPWHTDRSRIAEVVALVERIARSMAKIGIDIAILSSSEVGELRVRAGRSSSMPGKENPIDAVRAVAAADVCSAVAQIVTASRPHELDRAVGGWHAEWFALPTVFQTAGAAVEAICTALETMTVDVARMALHRESRSASPFASTPASRVWIDRVLGAFASAVQEQATR